MSAQISARARTMIGLALALVLASLALGENTKGSFSHVSDLILSSYGMIARPPVEPQAKLLVLLAGHSRTGTMTQKAALETLGYKVCHSIDIFEYKLGPLYRKALESDDGLNEFLDAVLQLGFNATSDLMFAFLTPRILKRFPDAKVVLAVRPNVTRWAESLCIASAYLRFAFAFPVGYFVDMEIIRLPFRIYGMEYTFPPCTTEWYAKLPWVIGCRSAPTFSRDLETFYHAHNQRVRDSVKRQGQLLEFSVEQGWDNLARFLGKPVPQQVFPRVNEESDMLLLNNILFAAMVAWPLVPLAFVAFVYRAGHRSKLWGGA